MPSWAELKKSLQKLLKKYEPIKDIIIFGSWVKGRDNPKDIDLAFIVEKRDWELISLIKKELSWEKIHIELIEAGEMHFHTLFVNLLNEGYSIKKKNYLRNILGIKPMKLYVYNLKNLSNKSEKTLFGIALNKSLVKLKGEKVGAGAVLIPLEWTSYFEDFLGAWGLKYKTKEYLVF